MGDLILLLIGVVRRHKMTTSGSRSSILALRKVFFAVSTMRSANPFDCAYLGEEVVWTNDHRLANSLKAHESNCGPLSV